MATPNKTVSHQGWIFPNSKTIFSLHPLIFFFKSQVAVVGGSGEGPQIGDSIGDQTQNLWFPKKIKLEREFGILEHMVH